MDANTKPGEKIKSYRKDYCEHCKSETVTFVQKTRFDEFLLGNAILYLLGWLGLFLSFQILFAKLDSNYYGWICAKCRKTPLKGARLGITLLGFLVLTIFGFCVLCIVLFNHSYIEMHGIPWFAIFLSFIYIFLGLSLLLYGIIHKRRKKAKMPDIAPFKEGDPCFFCKTSLIRSLDSLLCPTCDIKVES